MADSYAFRDNEQFTDQENRARFQVGFCPAILGYENIEEQDPISLTEMFGVISGFATFVVFFETYVARCSTNHVGFAPPAS